MKSILHSFAVLGTLCGLSTARADSRAGRAMADDSPSTTTDAAAGIPPAMQNCSNNCMQQGVRCANAGAGLSASDQSKVTNACALTVNSCVQACVAASGSTPVYQPAPRREPQSSPDDEPEPDYGPSVDQLVSSWKQTDRARVTEADRAAALIVQRILQALCQNTTVQGTACAVVGTPTPTTLGPPPAFGNRRAADRFTKSEAATQRPNKAKRALPRCRRNVTAAKAPTPGPFIRTQRVELCLSGTDCTGSTSAKVNGVELTMDAKVDPPSGSCIINPAERSKKFSFTLHATNTTNAAQTLDVGAPTLRTKCKANCSVSNGLQDFAGGEQSFGVRKIEPLASIDLTYASDCNDLNIDAWSGLFLALVVPYSPDTGATLTVNYEPPCTPVPPPPTGPSITATQGTQTVTPSGSVLTQIQ